MTVVNELREACRKPSDLIRRVMEFVPGRPNQLLPTTEAAKPELTKPILTTLCNTCLAWLIHAHDVLDEAVACGWG